MNHTQMYAHAKFPHDIIYEILSRCPPQALLSFTLVSTSYRSQAERLLYHTVKLDSTMGPRAIACLSTLSDVPKKAALVHTFMAFFRGVKFEPTNRGFTNRLRNALVNMVSLQHLWLRLPARSKVVESGFSECTFRLQSLCISEDLDISAWLAKQTTLRLLGFYEGEEQPNHQRLTFYVSLVKTARDNPLIVYNLTLSGGYFDTLTVFPGFSEPQAWNAKIISSSFEARGWPLVRQIDRLCVYLGNMAQIDTAIPSIAASFSHVENLVIAVRNINIHVYPRTISTALSKLDALKRLEIRYWEDVSDNDTSGRYQEQRHELAESWAAMCKNLTLVTFPDKVSSLFDKDHHTWG